MNRRISKWIRVGATETPQHGHGNGGLGIAVVKFNDYPGTYVEIKELKDASDEGTFIEVGPKLDQIIAYLERAKKMAEGCLRG